MEENKQAFNLETIIEEPERYKIHAPISYEKRNYFYKDGYI